MKGARSQTSPILMISKTCLRVTRWSLACEVPSGNLADEETTFLRLACQEVMNGDIQFEKHLGASGSDHGTLSDRLHGIVRLPDDQCECGTGHGRSKKWYGDVLLETQHGHKSVCHALSTLNGTASRWVKSSSRAQRVLMSFFTCGYWRPVQDPTFESATKRLEPRLRDILDDGVVRNNGERQYECACFAIDKGTWVQCV